MKARTTMLKLSLCPCMRHAGRPLPVSLSFPLPHTSKVPYGRGPSDSARARARSPQFLNGNTGKTLIRHGEVRAELQIAICLILPSFYILRFWVV